VLLASIGGLIGLLFGLCASVGEFCVRSAVLGMTEGSRRPQALAWLAAIGCAVISVQSAGALGLVDWSSARQVSSGGSLSGALTGGLLLGLGIGFARGCPSRQIVLASRGNLRSIATLIFIGIAVASSIDGALSSSVERISAIWPIGANSRTVSGLVGFGPLVGARRTSRNSGGSRRKATHASWRSWRPWPMFTRPGAAHRLIRKRCAPIAPESLPAFWLNEMTSSAGTKPFSWKLYRSQRERFCKGMA